MSLHPLTKLPAIRADQRASFLGPTGSGKSVLACTYLRSKRNVIVVDTKRLKRDIPQWNSVGESVSEREVYRCRGGRFVLHVDREFLTDPAKPEKLFRWVLERGNTVLFCDELNDIIPVDGLKILATQGRGNNASLWVATQRPVAIPLYTLTDVENTFVFKLRLEEDRERIEKLGVGRKIIPWSYLAQNKFTFCYLNEQGEAFGPSRVEYTEGRSSFTSEA